MKLETWLLVPDTHRPYHSKRAVALVHKVIEAIKPQGLAILGDYGDFYGVSSHSKNPNRKLDLDVEINGPGGVNEGLDEFDAHKCFKRKIFIAGNHEDRLERYLQDKAPELFNTVKLEKLLRLKERGYEYVPYKNHTHIGRLHLTHDTGKAGKNAHAQALQDFAANVVIGHTHRIGLLVEGNALGKPHVGAMLGWLGEVESVDYLHKISAMRNWALGFGIAYKEPNGNVHIVPIPIVDFKVVVNGQLFQA